jgi:hypothetical protein
MIIVSGPARNQAANNVCLNLPVRSGAPASGENHRCPSRTTTGMTEGPGINADDLSADKKKCISVTAMKQFQYLLIFLLLILLAFTPAMAGFSGRYPETGDVNGMVIDYRVEGADFVSQGPSSYSNTLAIVGTMTPGARTLTVSGTVYTSEYSADALISATRTSGGTNDGGQQVEKKIHVNPGSAPFSVSVSIPNSGLTDGGFNINLKGNYPPGNIPRDTAIDVSGSLMRSAGPGTTVGPSVRPPPPDEPGIPWLPIVGGIAAVAIAAAAIAKGLGKKKPDDQKKKDEGPAGYILQISPTDTIKVSTKESGSFTVTAWSVDENGSISRANNATITLLPPSQVPELAVAPTSGMGSITVNMSLKKPAKVNSAKIQIDASAGGKGTSAFVTVNFEAETNIEFD